MSRNQISITRIIVILFSIFLVCWLLLDFGPLSHEPSTRSITSRVRADMRVCATALDAYFTDFKAYPAWAIGPVSANHDKNLDSIHAVMPTFRVKQDTEDDLFTLTTPIAYLCDYPSDYFASELGITFAYWSLKNDWALWSPGPDRDFDIIDPQQMFPFDSGTTPSAVLLQCTWDPTNGSQSDGDIWRSNYGDPLDITGLGAVLRRAYPHP